MTGKKRLRSRDNILPVPTALVVTGTFGNPNIIAVSGIGIKNLSGR